MLCPEERDNQQEHFFTLTHSSKFEIAMGGQSMLQWKSDYVPVPCLVEMNHQE